ncbi:DNA invertase Pin-like site-specific DNA recombinase [Ureibacillus chungkukjangi]|uniref:DNA invertase Pin-like site-specific DNA recombinase n=1 Tax=Ureibacillus chungkukjangi TaxID=1202712 RepID=A0A318TKA3_9BACL|nr:DNA invertase Pin-like site-specific DNA recombinase [Ureibacillus chungkukjangi]
MAVYGYARVSTKGQDLEAQIQALHNENVETIYQEKFTGTSTERPKLKELLEVLQKGDKLVVTKLDRLARNTKEGIELVEQLFKKDVKVHVLNVGLLENTSMGRFFLTTLLAVAEMERNMIVERTQEGKAIAKLNPNYREGRPNKYTKKQLDHAISLLESNSYNQVADLTGISKSTLIRAVKNRKEYEKYVHNLSLQKSKEIEVSNGTENISNDDINVNFSIQETNLLENKSESNAIRNYELQEHHFDRFCNDCGESVPFDAEECGYCGSDSFDIMDLNEL